MNNKKLVRTVKNNLNDLLKDKDVKDVALLIDKSPPTVYRYLSLKNKYIPSVETLNILSQKFDYDIINFFK